MVRNSTIMEPTFYEEQQPAIYGPGGNRMINGSIGNMKRNQLRDQLTLDLNRQSSQTKKLKMGQLTPNLLNSISINSPDLFKLGSPEFEKLLNAQSDGLGITTMPTPTSQIYNFKVTAEQEQFSRGFVDALNELHHSDSSQEPGSIHGATYTNLEPPGSVQSTESLMGPVGVLVKDEPQTVPSVSSSPPLSPIDMETQEKIKLERKRQRNRVAASKCRRRKLERISRLEDKVRLLKGENSELGVVVNRLREHVSKLKEQVIDHMHSGCQIAAVPGIF